eukprot:c21452_g1_i1.p1 GENE.c21452_g1_i1~~c21452_g1_i1.p1  ORF type:complete len:165 (+),score=67.66 c21452_g1_i1:262-756(+)
MLIGCDGHIKLTDFGLSQFLTTKENKKNDEIGGDEDKSYPQMVHGTPDYLAPEILLRSGNGTPSDWWSLGIVTYEFLTGVPPFHSSTHEGIFQKILNNQISWPQIPTEMSEAAKNLISQLLNSDPNKRIGFEQLQQHPWFKDIDWNAIRYKTTGNRVVFSRFFR